MREGSQEVLEADIIPPRFEILHACAFRLALDYLQELRKLLYMMEILGEPLEMPCLISLPHAQLHPKQDRADRPQALDKHDSERDNCDEGSYVWLCVYMYYYCGGHVLPIYSSAIMVGKILAV